MPIFELNDEIIFPSPYLTDDENGVLAVGGDLSVERLLLAYSNGIFPWPHEGFPLLWFSPDPRMIVYPAIVHVSRSLRKHLKRDDLRLSVDSAFGEVLDACRTIPRSGEDGTWITDEMIAAYTRLHEEGWAHSFEVWRDDALVGGLYGVAVGGVFCGESMFHRERDASKVAFVLMCRQVDRWGFGLVDCQLPTEHLETLGGEEISRDSFLDLLDDAIHRHPGRPGRWSLDPELERSGGLIPQSPSSS